MRLSDLGGGLDLSALGVVALVLFASVFVAVALRALLASRAETERLARLPLEDGEESIR